MARSLALEEYVPYKLALLSSRLSHGLESACERECGISRTDWRVLASIAQQEGCPAASLVDPHIMDAVAVHRAVRRLETAGLVVAKAVEADRRMRLLMTTASGRKVYETLVPYALELEERMLSALPESNRAQFAASLGKLLSIPIEDLLV
ncbi:MarR family winged helix-turn-helix transcriptional regulator [Variovorax sp. J22P168]|nr:MarR family winged helix-turn-helix transcriptional regulator [Variovorax sp. J22P168]